MGMVPESGVQAQVRVEKPEALITVAHLSETGFAVHRAPQLFFSFRDTGGFLLFFVNLRPGQATQPNVLRP